MFMEPTTSANRTVTCLRPSAAPPELTGAPHTSQKRADARSPFPHRRVRALSHEALSGALLNVLSMETIIANTFRGSRTTKKVSAA